ncbi:50S ribosomal protein L25/general stress protein Ctc [Rickettsiales bacterium LUAb2]
MSNETTFIATKRTSVGKGASRLNRRNGDVPAIIYGNNIDPTPVYLEKKIVVKHLDDPKLYNNIYTVDVEGKPEEVLVREIQFNPLRQSDPTHINFLRVGKNTVTRIEVPIVFLNQAKSPGIKLGGILNITTHFLEVRCNPKSAPAAIEIDLADARIGSVVKIEDIKLPSGVRTFYPKGFAISSIAAPAEDDKAATAETKK